PETAHENESSVVQFANFDGRGVLLTGDAGVISLHEAANYAQHLGIPLSGLNFMQVPHHGSRHNVSPSVLDRWLGSRSALPMRDTIAFASVAKECETHPRRKVVNAFMRRGARVYTTKGSKMRHSYDMPARADYSDSVPLKFSNKVEK
ncbi:hypothetical protein, partial [Myxococcus vastator]|uniref:hypothetical protein n=1 Tax=Myxococcus vastator TaxID=2709664 RepID=UPI0023DDD39E